jgi:hypothetical protein
VTSRGETLITATQAAERIEVSTRTLYQWTSALTELSGVWAQISEAQANVRIAKQQRDKAESKANPVNGVTASTVYFLTDGKVNTNIRYTDAIESGIERGE